jgi:hypothetical protein
VTTCLAEALLAALALPPEARVDQRVPKKLLQEHGAATAADRRLIQEVVEEAVWVAALKPATVGTPAYRDEVREYLEIAVLTVALRGAPTSARTGRLVELVHRAIPYPVVLATTSGDRVALSLAHKRRSQAGAEGWVVEEVVTTAALRADAPDEVEAAFLASLALASQSSLELLAVYQAWMDRVTALAAARLTGHYREPAAIDDVDQWRRVLDEHARLAREAAALRAQAAKERQLARRVELNLAIRRADARIAELLATL